MRDYTAGNNPWGIGLGMQAFWDNASRWVPMAELTADIYLEDDKVLRSNPDGSFPDDGNDVPGMTNLFAGVACHLAPRFYISFTGGPSLINKHIFMGIKPSAGFFLSKNRKWMARASYINIFNRTKAPGDDIDFSSVSLALAFKLF